MPAKVQSRLRQAITAYKKVQTKAKLTAALACAGNISKTDIFYP